jgi:hypothetical protein
MSVVSFALALPSSCCLWQCSPTCLHARCCWSARLAPTGIGRRGGGTPSRRTTLAAAMQTPAGCPRLLPVVQGVDAAAGGRPPADPTPTFRRLLLLAHDSPARSGEDSRRTTRKGACSPEGVFHGADHPRRPSPARRPAASRPPRAARGATPDRRRAGPGPGRGSHQRDPVRVARWRPGPGGRLGPGDWVEAAVVDHGPAQPPHPPPTTDRLSSCGRGLWLLDRLVDEVRVERAALGTRVTLRRRIRSPSRPGEVVGSLRRVARSADPGVRRQRGLPYGRVLARGAAGG